MANALLIRGVPGSGKSTMAKTHFPSYKHFEADMFFVQPDGAYKWDGAKLTEAHRWCFIQYRDALAAGHDVVVTNVFAQLDHMEHYCYEAVNSGNHNIEILELLGKYSNVHGVSDEKVEQMRRKFQPITPEWRRAHLNGK